MAEDCLLQNENQRSEQLGRIIMKITTIATICTTLQIIAIASYG